MGFYIRKSVRVGPIRFNLSKSGIGVSGGITGLRLGVGPRGTYVHVGRGGVYYRQTLGGRASRRSQPSPRSRPTPAPAQPGGATRSATVSAMQAVATTDVDHMVAVSPDALVAEIQQKRRAVPFWPAAAVCWVTLTLLAAVSGVPPWLTVGITVVWGMVTAGVFVLDKMRRTVVLMYDLDPEHQRAFQAVCAAVDQLRAAAAVWHVTARGDVYDRKYHAGAGELLLRRPAIVDYRAPPRVCTNVAVPRIVLGTITLYFLPDRMLVVGARTVASVPYSALTVQCETVRFIEDGRVPRDATVVDRTWTYVNKNGGPDRRFSHNPQLPVCAYDQIRLTSPTGLHEVLQVSRRGGGVALRSAMEVMRGRCG